MTALKIKNDKQQLNEDSSRPNSNTILETIHKETIKPIVTKILKLYTLLLVLSCYSWTFNWAFIWGICIFAATFNIYSEDKSLNFKFGMFKVNWGQDKTDAMRWIVNLVLIDVPLSFLMGLSSIALSGFWTIVLLSILAETYNRSHRTLVFSIGLISSVGCMLVLNQDLGLKNSVFWVVNQITIAAFFLSIERFWNEAILQKLSSIHRMNEAVDQASKLKRDALIGEHARLISHEVANLMMGFNLMTKFKNEPEYMPLKAGLNYLQRISRLVLDEIQVEPMTQETVLSELVHDVNVILGRQVKQRRIQWQVIQINLPFEIKFIERSGSVYLMLQNMIKNAIEAIIRKHNDKSSGKIILELSYEADSVIIKIIDNGPGFSDVLMHQIRNGQATSNTIMGHGLGLKFVHSECLKNDFELLIGNNPNSGAYLGIKAKCSEVIPATNK